MKLARKRLRKLGKVDGKFKPPQIASFLCVHVCWSKAPPCPPKKEEEEAYISIFKQPQTQPTAEPRSLLERGQIKRRKNIIKNKLLSIY